MEQQKSVRANLSQAELQIIERLRRQPKMRERIEHILEVANASDGPMKTADEVEGLLVDALRQLGNDTMSGWAAQAEARASLELKRDNPAALKRKKKR